MKKLYSIVLMVSLLSATTAYAQEEIPRNKLTFGLKAGINYSNVWDEEGQDFEADPSVGFAGGAWLGIPLGRLLGLQPEIVFSQKGLRGSGTMFGSPYSFVRTTSYIDVPLQLQVKPVPALTVLGGVVYSYLVHERNTYTYGATYVDQSREFENDNLRKNLLGAIFGADVNIGHVVISARVAWDFQVNNGDGSYYTPRYKNQWAQLTVGLRI